MWIFAAMLAQAAPCDLDLVPPDPQVQGTAHTFQLTGATPGSNAYLFRDGDESPCPPQIAPHCLDLDGIAFTGTSAVDGSGVATFTVTVPAGIDPSEHAWQAGGGGCGLSEVEHTTAASPTSCAFDPLDWTVECASGPMGCFLEGWFDLLYPSGMPAFGTHLSVQQVRTGLAGADARTRAALALALSVDSDDLGLFGARASIGDRVVPSGPYVGYTVREVAVLAVASAPTGTALGDSAVQVLQTYDACGDDQLVMPAWPTFPPDVDPEDSGDGGVDSGAGADSAVDTGTPEDSAADPADDSGVVDTGFDAESGVVDTGVDVESGVVDTGVDAESGAPDDTVGSDSGAAGDDSGTPGDSGVVDSGIPDPDTEDSGG